MLLLLLSLAGEHLLESVERLARHQRTRQRLVELLDKLRSFETLVPAGVVRQRLVLLITAVVPLAALLTLVTLLLRRLRLPGVLQPRLVVVRPLTLPLTVTPLLLTRRPPELASLTTEKLVQQLVARKAVPPRQRPHRAEELKEPIKKGHGRLVVVRHQLPVAVRLVSLV